LALRATGRPDSSGRRRRLAGWLIMTCTLLSSSCVVPFPLDPEPPEEKTPPRILRDRVTPQFKADVEIDSLEDLTLNIAVEDPDIYDEIRFRVYRDYALAPDSQKLNTIIMTGGIPGADPKTPPSEELLTREQPFPIQKRLFCSSERGDVSGSQHYIEVVVTDAFNANSEAYPKWRATLSPPDVWGFVVICIQKQKSREIPGDEDNAQ